MSRLVISRRELKRRGVPLGCGARAHPMGRAGLSGGVTLVPWANLGGPGPNGQDASEEAGGAGGVRHHPKARTLPHGQTPSFVIAVKDT